MSPIPPPTKIIVFGTIFSITLQFWVIYMTLIFSDQTLIQLDSFIIYLA